MPACKFYCQAYVVTIFIIVKSQPHMSCDLLGKFLGIVI